MRPIKELLQIVLDNHLEFYKKGCIGICDWTTRAYYRYSLISKEELVLMRNYLTAKLPDKIRYRDDDNNSIDYYCWHEDDIKSRVKWTTLTLSILTKEQLGFYTPGTIKAT